MATFDDVVRLASEWPDVTVSTSYATPALKVSGKMFCRLWGERDFAKSDVHDSDVVVVYCEPDEKQFLLEESDGSVFSAAHYDGHPNVLLRLRDIDEGFLTSLLWESYLLQAPAKIRRQFPDA